MDSHTYERDIENADREQLEENNFESPEPSVRGAHMNSITGLFETRERELLENRRMQQQHTYSMHLLPELVSLDTDEFMRDVNPVENSAVPTPLPKKRRGYATSFEKYGKRRVLFSEHSGNLLDALLWRESFLPTCAFPKCRFAFYFYRAVVPGRGAAIDVKFPNIIFRRFTPDGKYLVCFSQDQKDLVIYRYIGPHLCSKPNVINEENDQTEQFTEPSNFENFFRFRYQLTVAAGSDILCKTFCLSALNGSILILASWSPPSIASEHVESTEQSPSLSSSAHQHERPALNFVPCLEKLSIFSVHVESGTIRDRFSLCHDFVDLENHSGVHLLDDTLLILSLRFQKLHVLKILPSGMFVLHKEIGPYCYEDDSLVIAQAEENERKCRERKESQRERQVVLNRHEDETLESTSNTGLGNGMANVGFYGGLMQRILSYFYTQAYYQSNSDGNDIRQFYSRFRDYSSFVMIKAQLLDARCIILKLVRAEDAQKASDPTQLTFFLGFYDMETTHFVGILPNNNEELYKVVENHADAFLHTSMTCDTVCGGFGPSVRYRFVNMSGMSRSDGTLSEAKIKKVLSSIPCSAQAFHNSPYLDRRLFSFDESKLPALQGYKMIPCNDSGVIKFALKSGGPVQFKLRCDFRAQGDNPENLKRLTMFLFHPVLPFVINFQQNLMEPLQLGLRRTEHEDSMQAVARSEKTSPKEHQSFVSPKFWKTSLDKLIGKRASSPVSLQVVSSKFSETSSMLRKHVQESAKELSGLFSSEENCQQGKTICKEIEERILRMTRNCYQSRKVREELFLSLSSFHDASFRWSGLSQELVRQSLGALEKDPFLSDLRIGLVPRKMKEENFWRQYFYQVEKIKQAVVVTSHFELWDESESLNISPETTRKEEENSELDRELDIVLSSVVKKDD
eukprot:jgi/Galph1/2678/GphlegSOOS_G1344.1